jgi:hypothetical protein
LFFDENNTVVPCIAAFTNMEETTWDLPVPGGPVITVRGCVRALVTASLCSLLSGIGSISAFSDKEVAEPAL